MRATEGVYSSHRPPADGALLVHDVIDRDGVFLFFAVEDYRKLSKMQDGGERRRATCWIGRQDWCGTSSHRSAQCFEPSITSRTMADIRREDRYFFGACTIKAAGRCITERSRGIVTRPQADLSQKEVGGIIKAAGRLITGGVPEVVCIALLRGCQGRRPAY